MSVEIAQEQMDRRKIADPPRIDLVAEAARERAHLDWRVRSGTMAYGAFEGSGIVVAFRDGRDVEVNVVAGTPEPESNYIPHGNLKPGEPLEMVTPLFRPE